MTAYEVLFSDWSSDGCSSDLIIVAINKIDKPGADPARVKQELLQHELITEDLGGDILAIEVSALKKTNLDKLEEAILLQSEVLELTANPSRPAEGVIIEARLEIGRAHVCTPVTNAHLVCRLLLEKQKQ